MSIFEEYEAVNINSGLSNSVFFFFKMTSVDTIIDFIDPQHVEIVHM